MCLAMNDDRLEPGERCASTSNRNFEGRQGAGGRTHLVSPAMAAAAADRRSVRRRAPDALTGDSTMHTKKWVLFGVVKVALIAAFAALMFAGCNTMEGVGKDLEGRREARGRRRLEEGRQVEGRRPPPPSADKPAEKY
jgi:hypothetical protein